MSPPNFGSNSPNTENEGSSPSYAFNKILANPALTHTDKTRFTKYKIQ